MLSNFSLMRFCTLFYHMQAVYSQYHLFQPPVVESATTAAVLRQIFCYGIIQKCEGESSTDTCLSSVFIPRSFAMVSNESLVTPSRDGIRQWRCDQRIVDYKHYIHGARFFYELVVSLHLSTIPGHILLPCFLCRIESAAVVARHIWQKACPALCCTYVLPFYFYLDRSCIQFRYRTRDDNKPVLYPDIFTPVLLHSHT